MLPPDADRGIIPEVARAHRRAARERAARQEAESLLEQKSLELFHTNEKLREQAVLLEEQVEERTAELKKALELAREATRAKSDFLATMSHEIRTPLNGILGLADLLSMGELNSEQLDHLQLLIRSGHTLLALINDILDFSKIEAGKLDLDQHDFDLALELESVAETFRPQAESKGLNYRVQIQVLPGHVRGDSLRLRQILSNLISNAIKFTPAGSIDIHATTDWTGGENRLTLEVSDSGIGISEKVLHQIFQPFTQADSSISRHFGGTGLGLAITYQLVQAMKGKISVDSGNGTTFRVELPLARAKQVAQPSHGDPDDGDIPAMQILVVDDHHINRTVAVSLLRRIGQTADEASSGSEAIEKIQHNRYDLIFMDMQMPVMDGLDATRKIRQLSLERQPRIVALTANAYGSDREKCLSAGMNGFLPKPFQLDELKREVKIAGAEAGKPR